MATEYGTRLRTARKLRGLTQIDLSRATGIPQSTISTAEREGTKSLETTTYATALKVRPEWLASGDEPMEVMTADMAGHATLSRHAQPLIRTTDIVYSSRLEIPILTAQTTNQWRNYLTGALKAERTHRYHGENIGTTFAYEVNGDMMQPDFPDGSLAIIETDITPQHGDVILIQDGTVTYLRKLVIDGQDKMIITLDDRYPAKFLRGEVIGVVSGSFIPRLSRRDRV